MRNWFLALSVREKILIGLLLLLVLVVGGWYGVWRPLDNAIDSSRERHQQAVQKNASIMSKVALFETGASKPPVDIGGPLSLYIAQTAAEQGFTMENNTPRGNGQVAITIASAKAVSFFSWIAALEETGIIVRELNAKASPNGTIAVTATLARPR